MIGCQTKTGIEYITKLEDFRELISDGLYQALTEFVYKNYKIWEEEINELRTELNESMEDAFDLDNDNDELRNTIKRTENKLDKIAKSEMTREEIIEEIKQILKYL